MPRWITILFSSCSVNFLNHDGIYQKAEKSTYQYLVKKRMTVKKDQPNPAVVCCEFGYFLTKPDKTLTNWPPKESYKPSRLSSENAKCYDVSDPRYESN